MARLFQVTIAAEDSQPKSPMQIALLNPDKIQIMDDAAPGTAQTHILYKVLHGQRAIDILVNAPVSALSLLINAATTTNSLNTIRLTVYDDSTGITSTIDVDIKDIWKVIDDPAVSATTYLLLENQVGLQFKNYRCLETLQAIKTAANS